MEKTQCLQQYIYTCLLQYVITRSDTIRIKGLAEIENLKTCCIWLKFFHFDNTVRTIASTQPQDTRDQHKTRTHIQ